MKSRRLATAAFVVLSLALAFWLSRQTKPSSPPPPPETLVVLPPGYAPTIGSPLARELNAPAATARHDLTVLHDLLGQFTTTYRSGQLPPLGDNADITAALTGGNRQKIVFLPPDHPAIRNGQLLDRWGTPYFFHPTSAEVFQLRSAGPDRSLFTADDIIAP